MLVEKRPNESRRQWKARARIAQSVEKFGLRVICLDCRTISRHRHATAGPLRDVVCEECAAVGKLRRCRPITNGRTREVAGFVPGTLPERIDAPDLDAEIDSFFLRGR